MEANASSSQADFGPEGALDDSRFECGKGEVWRGRGSEGTWWWEVRFDEPRQVGVILQVNGDDACIFRNAPRRYVWQWSEDGKTWRNLEETRTERERRAVRAHRLNEQVRASCLRLQVFEAEGDYPALREVECLPNPEADVSFDDWVVVVSTTENPELPGEGVRFLDLARMCDGWEHLQAQHVWLDTFDEAFVSAEPRPLCAFLSGSFKDWCERTREPFRGTQCMRRVDRPIYAAQFHIELFDETVEHSKRIMGSFLEMAKEWGGYNPEGAALEAPKALEPGQ